MRNKPSPSPECVKILKYINSTPRLLSLLYDLNLLPELVERDPANKRAMIACYFGYRVGLDSQFNGVETEPKAGQ